MAASLSGTRRRECRSEVRTGNLEEAYAKAALCLQLFSRADYDPSSAWELSVKVLACMDGQAPGIHHSSFRALRGCRDTSPQRDPTLARLPQDRARSAASPARTFLSTH